MNIERLTTALFTRRDKSTNPLVQEKCKRALANIKRARTLLNKAELILQWAEIFENPHNWTSQ